MSTPTRPRPHSFVQGGYSFRVASRLGFEPATTPRRLTKILLLILVTWVPLVVLSFLNGRGWGHSVREPLLLDPVISTWERLGNTITPAGWWYILVSLPILAFFLLRWAWIFLLWAWFLFCVSRLDLELTPTHPDRAGGLGFLGWGLASFSPILMAVSASLSGAFAREIIHRGSSLDSLKYHAMVFLVLAIVVVHAPLLVFAGKQARCRFEALLNFGTLIWRHDRDFDEKWIKPLGTSRQSLLGSPDAASLADIGMAYEHVDRMQLIPFDKKAVVVLLLATVMPMVPLLGIAVPLMEILSKLSEFII